LLAKLRNAHVLIVFIATTRALSPRVACKMADEG